MAIYLDNAATSFPKPPAVYERMIECLRTAGANPGRSGHRLARAAQQMVEDTRLKLARLVGAAAPEQIVFTFNATDALNIAIKGALLQGDHVITTELEHNSVLRPLQGLAAAGKITVTLAGFDREGFVIVDEIEAAITPQTRMIAVTAGSNVLGTLQPIAEIGRLARAHDLLLLVDAAQTLGVVPMNAEELKIDLLAAAGHKALLGPPGTGMLYVGARAGQLACWREGGTGGDSLSALQPEIMPFNLEAGTHNTGGLAGLGAALDYLAGIGIEHVRAHEQELTRLLLNGLSALKHVTVYGCRDLSRRLGTVAFAIEGYRSDEAAAILDESFDIAVRAGLHCAPLTHKRLGTAPDGLIRASIGPFNSVEDINALINAVEELTTETQS